MLSSQLEIQEQTLKRIASEIHDNISLSLTLAKLNLNTFSMGSDKVDIDLVQSGIELIGRALADLNNLSKSLDAQTIERYGLVHALEAESELVRKSGRLSVDLGISGKAIAIESERDIHVFRIVQECFNNTLKHAAAENLSVDLDYGDEELQVTVSDDGRGFDLASCLASGTGAGLRNMRNRATILGGSLRLESHVGEGTKTIITIPYKTSDANKRKDPGGPGR